MMEKILLATFILTTKTNSDKLTTNSKFPLSLLFFVDKRQIYIVGVIQSMTQRVAGMAVREEVKRKR